MSPFLVHEVTIKNNSNIFSNTFINSPSDINFDESTRYLPVIQSHRESKDSYRNTNPKYLPVISQTPKNLKYMSKNSKDVIFAEKQAAAGRSTTSSRARNQAQTIQSYQNMHLLPLAARNIHCTSYH